MNKNAKGFGCILLVISFFVAIAVGISKLNNNKGEFKRRIVKRIRIK